MSAYALPASMDLGTDAGPGDAGAAANYARAAARYTEERDRLQRSGARPSQARALGAMADLLHTLAAARRARDDADRRLAGEPLETPDDLLAGYRPCDVTILRSTNPERA